MWTTIAQQISQATGSSFAIQDRRSVGGGCINQAYQLTDTHQSYFLKLNRATQLAMFEAEALGLKAIDQSQAIRVPRPICWGLADSQAFLVLDWLEFGYGDEQSWHRMGTHLAAMHRTATAQCFGWERPNTIGDTPQHNPWTESWL